MWQGQQGPWSRNPPQGPKESEAEPMPTRPPLCKLRVGSQEARRPCSSPKVNAKGGVAAGFVLTSKRASWTPRARSQRWGAKWDTGSSSWTLGPRETPPPQHRRAEGLWQPTLGQQARLHLRRAPRDPYRAFCLSAMVASNNLNRFSDPHRYPLRCPRENGDRGEIPPKIRKLQVELVGACSPRGPANTCTCVLAGRQSPSSRGMYVFKRDNSDHGTKWALKHRGQRKCPHLDHVGG